MQFFPHFRIFKNKSTTFSVQERKSWFVFFFFNSFFKSLSLLLKSLSEAINSLKEEEVEMSVEDHIQ